LNQNNSKNKNERERWFTGSISHKPILKKVKEKQLAKNRDK